MPACDQCDGLGKVWPTGAMAESEAGLLGVPCPACDGTGRHRGLLRRLFRGIRRFLRRGGRP